MQSLVVKVGEGPSVMNDQLHVERFCTNLVFLC